jgi:hypothetical protein
VTEIQETTAIVVGATYADFLFARSILERKGWRVVRPLLPLSEIALLLVRRDRRGWRDPEKRGGAFMMLHQKKSEFK